MKNIDLPNDYAIVIQQIYDCGEEDFNGLAQELNFRQGYLAQIIASLSRKRLIVTKGGPFGILVRLSSRGKRLVRSLWPESIPAH